MATKLTSKKPLTGNKRSHALNATKTKQNTNQLKNIKSKNLKI